MNSSGCELALRLARIAISRVSNDRRVRLRHTPEPWPPVALDVDIAESAAIARLAETEPGSAI
jgi:hypothetical protein